MCVWMFFLCVCGGGREGDDVALFVPLSHRQVRKRQLRIATEDVIDVEIQM